MRKISVSAIVFFAAITALSGCNAQALSPGPNPSTGQTEHSNFPYDPLVYHLDLSILAYQLYSQTLVWPFDPYYEVLENGEVARLKFMDDVRQWADGKGQQQTRQNPPLGGYRGPGRLAGFADNQRHDPIIYRYDGVYPWKNMMANVGERVVEYLTPTAITGTIGSVQLCYRRTGRPADDVAVEFVVSKPSAGASGARDVLLAFEGGTGDKGEEGQPASQSLMGFVLLRYLGENREYNIHIAFRGSRGGSVARSVRQGLSTEKARGNPDWITDLGYRLIEPGEGANHITTVGKVHRGFATSMQSILPQLSHCLNKAADLAPNHPPNNIYVTGHSLGGGLAQHFVSAVLLGDQYGPDGTGAAMPDTLRRWPWQQIKLITYGSPRAGNAVWADTLTTKGLASEFHAGDLLPLDFGALSSRDPSISIRLADAGLPAGYRVLISNDAITTSALPGRKPVGKSVYVDKVGRFPPVRPYDSDSHEPAVIRKLMLEVLDGSDIPPVAWRYHEFPEAPSGGSGMQKKKNAKQMAIQTQMIGYLQKNGADFDQKTYEHHVELFNSFLNAP
ncbi:MAG: lipase family protein [Stappiaceae bacterium]